MGGQPIDDIEAWSKKLSPWRQDCLRRLAISDELTETDFSELLALIKLQAGFTLATQPPTPVAFTKAHFSGGKHQPIVLKGIANVQNVNRLVPNAGLTFCPKSLTIVYGRNGSGKTGFVRILRTACRTRVENPAKLRVLADVYGGGSGAQSADILIDTGSGDVPIAWSPGVTAAPQLMQVAVFDAASAQLYVDGGNQIRFLPFGLALPHRLNTVCLILKERLEGERAAAVGNMAALTAIAFNPMRVTTAQTFDKSVSETTTQVEIESAATFAEADQAKLDQISALLAAGATAAADVSALATWTGLIATECETGLSQLSDAALGALSKLKTDAVSAREAARLVADAMFTDEPLPGVGSESWRVLWKAARDYSVSEAYVGRDYPVTALEGDAGACVLCQQPLLDDAAARMIRFQKFIDDTLDVVATKAEAAVAGA